MYAGARIERPAMFLLFMFNRTIIRNLVSEVLAAVRNKKK